MSRQVNGSVLSRYVAGEYRLTSGVDSVPLISTFATEFERLGGRCYIASGVKEVVDKISEIASQNKCVNLVKQRLDIDGEDQIETLLASYGYAIVQLEDAEDPVSALNEADLALTPVDMMIASTGTVVISTRSDEAKLSSCLPRIHIAVATAENIVQSPLDSAAHLRKQFEARGCVSFVSGPSRTADIEMKLILGVHGPYQVHVMILKR